MLKFLSKIFPSKSEKDINRITPIVAEINEYVSQYTPLSDDELKGKTQEFRGRINEATRELISEITRLKEKLASNPDLPIVEREGLYDQIEVVKKQVNDATREALDELLPEAYALVKEGCRRLVGKSWEVTGRSIEWDMVPFDVQLIGGVVLHEGKIAEMATGEGKTLVATMPIYLNALPGRGVHLVTVNDYLALRDSEWMGKVFEFLGLTVGCIQSQMDSFLRRKQYA